jgi:putative transcriptional regulator
VFGNIGFLTGEIDEALRPSILRARVYAGHSGWGSGQLEDELAENAWIIEPARPEDVFTDEPGSLWKRVLQRKGGKYRHIAMVPKDPRVN